MKKRAPRELSSVLKVSTEKMFMMFFVFIDHLLKEVFHQHPSRKEYAHVMMPQLL